MTPRIDANRWSQIRAAFDDIVELDFASRTQRLGEFNATDPELRRAVEQLLAADEHAETQLARLDSVLVSGAHANESVADPLMLAGQSVSHFRIIEPLAKGGMGVVYRAEDTQLHRNVALKFPLPSQRLDSRAKERFLHEARAAGALEHPNVCSIHEVGETAEGELFLAMTLYEGETLKERLAREGPLPVAEALGIARQITQGLTAAHGKGIIHRDLKPANVMLCRDGTVRVLDFGLAKVEDLTLTASNTRVGTVSYMAPEQVGGQAVDGRTDLWSLGVVLFEMLTGQKPFGGEQDVSIAHAIVHEQPPLPSTLRNDITRAVDDLIVALLQKLPANRQRTATEVDAELAAIQLGHMLPGRLRWPRRMRASYQRIRARPRRAVLAAVTIAAITLAAGGWIARGLLRSESAATIGHSVGVLPFANPGSQTGVEYFSVGLFDGLINQLTRIHDIRVSSRQTAIGYRFSTKPLREIAAELKVATILQGSVERVGDRVRVTVRLLNPRTNAQLWADEYERQPNEILSIQEEIAREIARTLGVQVTRGELAELEQRPTSNAQAYELYLRGHEYEMRTPSLEAEQSSATLYRQAIELDSTFALAHARLAAVTIDVYTNGFDRNPARLDQARAHAESALRLQPNLADGRFALGYYWSTRAEYERALEQFTLASKVAPNNAEIHAALGITYRSMGRDSQATAALERSFQLDPGDIRMAAALAGAYRGARKYADAVKFENYVIARVPDGYMHMLWKGFEYLLWQGRTDTLAAMVNRVPAAWNQGGTVTRARIMLARLQRRPADALAALNEARESEINQHRPAMLLRAQAFEGLSDVVRARSSYEALRVAFQDSVSKHPDDAVMMAFLGLAHAGLGQIAIAENQARRAVAKATRNDKRAPDRFALLLAAEVFARTRNADAAVDVLDRLLSISAGGLVSVAMLRVDPLWDPIRSAPRFQQLIDRHQGKSAHPVQTSAIISRPPLR